MVRLVDDHGRPVHLGLKLGEGGEGAVYRLADDSRMAVKIYSKPMAPERESKIATLAGLRDSGLDSFVARPSSLVRDVHGRARGLLLPVVDRGADVHNLYTPASRRSHFPDATWQFLVHVAANVARAFASVHQAGLVIGDVNPGSIMVRTDGTIRLIDVDSFQVPAPGGRSLLCTVAVPMFLPPELKDAQLDRIVRTPDHDCFGLAVTLFQLLMLGRHPFAGRFLGSGDMPVERAVAEERFAYGVRAQQLQMAPPPNTVGLNILPPQVADLFEAAFAPRSLGRPRPTAVQWVTALDRLKSAIVRCSSTGAHHYWGALSECPWCRLERRVGISLFAARPPTTASSSVVDDEYRQLNELFGAIRQPAPPQRPQYRGAVTATPRAVAAKGTPGSAWLLHTVGALLVLLGVVFAAQGGLLLMVAAGGFIAGGFGTAAVRRRPWVAGYRLARERYGLAERLFDNAIRFPQMTAARAEAERARRAWDRLPAWRAERLRQLEAEKRKAQLRRHLESQLIENGRIQGIGAGRVTLLSAYGIDTAFDIEADRILQVPRFGPVLTDRLVRWRRTMESGFVFRPQERLPPEVIAELDRQVERQRRKALEDLRSAIRALQAAVATEPAEAAQSARWLFEAEAALRQATVDVEAATGRVPA